jgi:peptidyl-dipeptidase Dcp
MERVANELQPWDWDYYSKQVRKAKFDIEDAQVRPYFELNQVLENGVFYAANQLYGLTFSERKDIPVYHPDVRVFEVKDADGKPLALFYCDYFKRDNKNGGAWMSNLVGQSKLLGTLPVVYNVANFSKPARASRRSSALRCHHHVSRVWPRAARHVFGLEYPSLSGTSVARDFVEFPSQFNEHWATYPAVFNHYAKHYETGAPMPAELAAKLKKGKLSTRDMR